MGDYYNQFFGDCEMIVKKNNSVSFYFCLLFLTVLHKYHIIHHSDTQTPTH